MIQNFRNHTICISDMMKQEELLNKIADMNYMIKILIIWWSLKIIFSCMPGIRFHVKVCRM